MKLLASEEGLCFVEFVSGTWLHPSRAAGLGAPQVVNTLHDIPNLKPLRPVQYFVFKSQGYWKVIGGEGGGSAALHDVVKVKQSRYRPGGVQRVVGR